MNLYACLVGYDSTMDDAQVIYECVQTFVKRAKAINETIPGDRYVTIDERYRRFYDMAKNRNLENQAKASSFSAWLAECSKQTPHDRFTLFDAWNMLTADTENPGSDSEVVCMRDYDMPFRCHCAVCNRRT